ncbi:MAG: hypothetical protein PHT53_04910, partial [Candidatus Omnitrophica bacterium]|nr:hypothetical protein [Candidatus Omnitrophota bacterium]
MIKTIISLLLVVFLWGGKAFAQDSMTISWTDKKEVSSSSNRSLFFSNPLPSISFKSSNLNIVDAVVLTSVTTPEGVTRDVEIFLPLDLKTNIISTKILTMGVLSGAGSFDPKGKYQVKVAVYSINKSDSANQSRGSRISNELSYRS